MNSFFDSLTLKMKALWSFKTLGTPHPVSWHHISEDFNNPAVRTWHLLTSSLVNLPVLT